MTAEDGNVYERSAIDDWVWRHSHPQSPLTKEPMGRALKPAPSVKDTIRTMIESGAIAGEMASAWQTKIKEQEEFARAIEEWRLRGEAVYYKLYGGAGTFGNGLDKNNNPT